MSIKKMAWDQGYSVGVLELDEQHKRYRAATVDLCYGSMAGKVETPVKIAAFLREWWSEHVLKADMAYKSFLNGKGVR